MDVIRKNSFPELAERLKAALDACPNVSQAFIKAGEGTQTAYNIASGNKPSVELSVLERVCRALGISLESLGVVFEPEPQTLLPIKDAPVGVPVLGVFWDAEQERHWFVDVTLSVEGKMVGLDDFVYVPDGFLPLPVVGVDDE